MKIVSVKSGVNTESVKEDFLFVGVSIAINIIQFPDVRINGGKYVAPVRQHTGNYAVNLLVETFRVHFCHISLAVIIGILE